VRLPAHGAGHGPRHDTAAGKTMTTAVDGSSPPGNEAGAPMSDQSPATPAPPLGYRYSLPTKTVSVPASRTLAAEALDAWAVAPEHPVRETVLLVLSELVTNSVRHAARLSPQVDVALGLSDGTLTIAVHDRHPHRPKPLREPRRNGAGGWGLRLVKTLAAEASGSMDIVPDDDGRGKTVAVRLPLR
jgi:anti-sigma regulatory factor (Ser/Thr protein kinase)